MLRGKKKIQTNEKGRMGMLNPHASLRSRLRGKRKSTMWRLSVTSDNGEGHRRCSLLTLTLIAATCTLLTFRGPDPVLFRDLRVLTPGSPGRWGRQGPRPCPHVVTDLSPVHSAPLCSQQQPRPSLGRSRPLRPRLPLSHGVVAGPPVVSFIPELLLSSHSSGKMI